MTALESTTFIRRLVVRRRSCFNIVNFSMLRTNFSPVFTSRNSSYQHGLSHPNFLAPQTTTFERRHGGWDVTSTGKYERFR